MFFRRVCPGLAEAAYKLRGRERREERGELLVIISFSPIQKEIRCGRTDRGVVVLLLLLLSSVHCLVTDNP